MAPYHQQSSAGPPYVIGPGQYNAAQFSYRPQQASFQQQASPTQQQQLQSGRPTFVGISTSTNSPARLTTSHHPSVTPYFGQQNTTPNRVQQPQQQQTTMQQSSQQQFGQQTPRPAMIPSHMQPQQQQQQQQQLQQHVQQQMIRVQQPQQQMVQQQSPSNARMVGPGQVIVTTNSGLMIPSHYVSGQGSYPRQVVLSQQPIVVQQPPQQQQTINVMNPQQQQQQTQPAIIHYQYKQQQQSIPPQMQQTPPQSVVSKQQPTASPSSSSASSTPAPQFATPNQVMSKLDMSGGSNLSPSPASISNAASGGPSSQQEGASGNYLPSDSSQVLTKQRLEDLVREVDPYEQLDEEVKDALLHIADEFIESVVSGACQIAKHRKANAIDVKDVQLCLERNWNMWIPGFGSDDVRPYKKACVTEAHKQRTSLIKKTLKKI